jgi:branched-chain amino acid transport system substrate-binding protein
VGFKHWGRMCAVGAVVVTTVVAATGTGGAAPAGPDQGVTDKAVKVGFIYSGSGVAASSSATSDAGCKARVGRENAKGGVNGRKIDVIYKDDKSSAANLQEEQDLVQNDKVFAVVNNSSFAFLGYRYLRDNGTPLIGSGIDGTYYSDPGNEKIIPAYTGNGGGKTVSEVWAKIMKAQGATKTAAVGYGISPASTKEVKVFQKFAVPANGMEPVYSNTSVDFGTTDVSPVALAIKNSGADGAFYVMDLSTNLAIAQNLAQNGVKMKSQQMATGYGQGLLDQPVAKTLGSDVVFTQPWQPVELKTKATKRLQADLKKYSDYKGVPDFGVYTGYSACDLLITGLKQAGKTLDQSTFTDGIRKVGMINPAGLRCMPVDFSANTIQQAPKTDCLYAVTVKNDKFKLLKPKGGKDFWTGRNLDINENTDEGATTTTAGS